MAEASEPSVLPPSDHAQLIEAARTFLAEMETMTCARHGAEAFIAMSQEQRQMLVLNLAIQALLQPSSWHAENMSLDNAAFVVASGIAAVGAEGNEEQSAALVRHIINGYTAGRMQGIFARQQFKTTGRAN